MRQPLSVDTENFELIFENLNRKVMNKLRVATLARVISVENVEGTNLNTVTVQPIVEEKINCDNDEGYKYIKLPKISGIPCIMGQNPQVNDYVLCLHSDRTMLGINLFDETNTTGFIQSTNSRHDINDCVAVVLKTRDEWTELGTYDVETSDIELNNFEKLSITVLDSSESIPTIVANENINKFMYNQFRISFYKGSSKHVEFSIVDNKLNILDIASGYSVKILVS